MSDEMTLRRKKFGDFVQIGIVVRDIDRTISVLEDVFGIGPFRTCVYPTDDGEETPLFLNGKPAKFSHRLAFADLGPIELELVQPLEGESLLTEFLDKHGEGINHIRFNVPDLSSTLEYLSSYGIESSMSGGGLRPGTTWMHLNTEDKIGFIIELMDVLPGTDGRTPQDLEEIPE